MSPCLPIGKDGLRATLHDDHLELSDGNESVRLTLDEAHDLAAFVMAQRIFRSPNPIPHACLRGRCNHKVK